MYMYIVPIIEFDVGVGDWVVLEPHQVKMEDRRKFNKHNSFLSFLRWRGGGGEGERGRGRGGGGERKRC